MLWFVTLISSGRSSASTSKGFSIKNKLLIVFFCISVIGCLMYFFLSSSDVPLSKASKPLQNKPKRKSIEKIIQEINFEQISIEKKIKEIPVQRIQIQALFTEKIKPLQSQNISETNKVLLDDEIKAFAETLLALDAHEIKCQDILDRLIIANRHLNRNKNLSDYLGENTKTIDNLSSDAADVGAKLSINIAKIIGSGAITDAKIQEKISELSK